MATAHPANSFTQNTELERKLSVSDPQSLALFPAKGHREGAAGFFRTHYLYVVPNSERAWCQDQSRGVLKAGCYVEFHFHRRGLTPRDEDGEPCGHLARWYKAPRAKGYIATPGSPFASAIARGDPNGLDLDLDEVPAAAHFRDVRRRERCAAQVGHQ